MYSSDRPAVNCVIGASKDAAATILRPPGPGFTCLGAALLALNVFSRVPMLLDAARQLPDFDMSIVDAAWKRCGEVRLPQRMIQARVVLYCL